nr:amino acid racemase [uncultured Sellimonas sp.]
MKKRLGVIGGMGPEATAYFYEEVIRHTKAESDQEHIDMTILSHATMPDRTKAIISGDDRELLEAMKEDVQALEMMKVSNIAIPCNTSHFFYDDIQAMTTTPIIHMPREAVRYAKEHYENVKKIGIMGTDGTIRSGIYHKECERLGIEAVAPSEKRQKDVMSLIYDDVKAGKKGDYQKFERTMEEFIKKDCDVVILACTEISVFKKDHVLPAICLDAMDVLIRESVLRSGAEYK